MSIEEWRAKSDDWRKGWRDCQESNDAPDNPSDDYIAGYQYAIKHPFGSVAIPM